MSKFVKSYVENNVLHLELDRLEKKNSLTTEMYLALSEVLRTAEMDQNVRVILIKGGLGCFCAGNDIQDFLDEAAIAPGSPIANFLHLLVDIQKPMVAAVSGPAIGIGTTLLLHCDLVYATNKTVFSLPFVNLGVCAEAASSYLLAQQVGHVRAAELLLLGDSFGADKAKKFGLINEIVDEDDYWAFAQKQAETIARKPLQALLTNKALMKQEKDKLHQVIDNEIESFSMLLKTAEAKAIFQKFLSK